MKNAELKEKIHSLVETSDEETLQSVLQLLENTEYTEEFKQFLNEEQADYFKNKNVISREDVNNLVNELLRK